MDNSKVYLVSYDDWNDETTIQGIFSSLDKARVFINSTSCDFLRHIQIFELDKVDNIW